MNVEKLNVWLNLVANLGVIAGIVFLAVEISQNTTAIRAEIYQTRAFEVANANDFRAESQYLVPIQEKTTSSTEIIDYEAVEALSWIERRRLWLAMDGMIRRFDNNLYQCEIGYLEPDFCLSFAEQVRINFPAWEFVASTVGAEVNPAFHRIYAAANQ